MSLSNINIYIRKYIHSYLGVQHLVHSLYGSKTRGPEDDSVQSKHVALISHYMFNTTTVVFDRHLPPFIAQN